MNNTDSLAHDDSDDMMTDGDDSVDSYVPPTPKDQFLGLISRIQAAATVCDSTYSAMIAQAMPFDRGLAAKLEGARKADLDLFAYVKSKVEAGDDVPSGVVAGLFGR